MAVRLDTRLRGDSGEMLRVVLNTGFQRSGKVTICVGDEHEYEAANAPGARSIRKIEKLQLAAG